MVPRESGYSENTLPSLNQGTGVFVSTGIRLFREGGNTDPFEKQDMRQDKNEPKVHWTHKLFVENAELYLPFLEQAKERAQQEVEALSGLFTDFGVPSGGRVLDLACGIGRHSVLLSELGYEVTGFDISPLYIEKAREYAASENSDTRFVVGDALNVAELLDGEKPYDACVNMFTSHSYYGREGDLRMFGGVANLSAAGAVLVVMTINRDSLVRRFESEGFQTAGGITIHETRWLDLETSWMMNTWDFYEGAPEELSPRLSVELNNRVYSLHEMKALVGLLSPAGSTEPDSGPSRGVRLN